MRILTIVLAVAAATAGCKDKSSVPAKANAPIPDPAPQTTEPTVPTDQQPSTGAPEHVEKMFQQLDTEKNNRPGLAPTVETVIAKLEGAGIKFDEQKQVLGLTVGAKYCYRAGVNTSGLNVVVCEHATAKEAEDGVALIKSKFAQLAATSTFTIKGTTTIQVMDRPNEPLTDVRRTIDAALATL